MNTQLFFTNLGFSVTFLVCFGLGILVYARRPEKNSSANLVYLFFSIAACIWEVSYVLGINLHDPIASRNAFMFNVAALFLMICQVHLILILTDRYEKRKKFIWFLYSISSIFTVYIFFFPEQFLLPSEPRLYLPNFFVPGPLYVVQDSLFFFAFVYLLVQLVVGYRTSDVPRRKKLQYFIVGLIYGNIVALIPEFLLYGYDVDPMPAGLTGFFAVPYAYAIIKYDVIDVKIVAKKAFGYTLSVVAVTMFILLVGFVNDSIIELYPSVPEWAVPLASAVLAVVVGIMVWTKLKEVDLLKYQFIDVVCHKFRTPLTHIRWSLETLRLSSEAEERTKAINDIDDANVRLVELTDMLVGLNSSDTNDNFYTPTPSKLSDVINEISQNIKFRLEEKHMHLDIKIPHDLPMLKVGHKNFEFVAQMLIENAITYSKPSTAIILEGSVLKDNVVFAVRDQGIGISKENLPHIFSKFFRGAEAMHANTEGLGIGLYLSRNIMRQLGGDLQAESPGVGLGSTFKCIVPIYKGRELS